MPVAVGNACGTFALIHALGNAGLPLGKSGNLHELIITLMCCKKTGPGPLQTLFAAARPLSPPERSALLAADTNLASAHSSAASTDTQTAVPNLEDDVELHFVTFVEWEGQLVELDGRRKGAVARGKIQKGLLEVSNLQLLKVQLVARARAACVSISLCALDECCRHGKIDC